MEKVIIKIMEYFEGNMKVFENCLEELDSHNGYLGNRRYYAMSKINDIYSNVNPLKLLYLSYFGGDADTVVVHENGVEMDGEFNPCRKYFYCDRYGHLISTDYKDYLLDLNKSAIESMAENRKYISAIKDNEKLSALFDELKEEV